MSEAKFTPGPWSTGFDGHGGVYIEDADGKQVGFVSHGNVQNAALIKSAPDLLEALHLCVGFIEAYGERETKFKVRSAIAKATGASQ